MGFSRSRGAIAVIAISSLLFSACSSTPAASTTASASGPAASGPAASGAVPGSSTPSGDAVSLTYWSVADSPLPNAKFKYFEEFTAATGIKVNVVLLPEAGLKDKVAIALQGKSSEFDLWDYATGFAAQVQGYQGAMSMNSYFADTAKTPADFDLADIPETTYATCTINGEVYCIPLFNGSDMIFYRKDHFAEAGIASTPKTWDEVVAAAEKLTTDKHAGWCNRQKADSPVWYPANMMLQYFIPEAPDRKGIYLDANYRPLLGTPEGIAMGTTWQSLVKYSPKGAASLGYNDCMAGIFDGTVSMFFDSATLAAQFYNPAANPEAAKTKDNLGYMMLPCPEVHPHCNFASGWGAFINNNIDQAHKDAAYKLMTFFSSKDVVNRIVSDVGDPSSATRESTFKAVAAGEVKLPVPLPADLLEARQYGLGTSDPVLDPPIAAYAEVQNALTVAMTNITAGKDVATEFKAADAQITTILTTSGDIKP